MNFKEQLLSQIEADNIQKETQRLADKARADARQEERRLGAIANIPAYVSEIKTECLENRHNRIAHVVYKDYHPAYLIPEELKNALISEGLLVTWSRDFSESSNDIDYPQSEYYYITFTLEW